MILVVDEEFEALIPPLSEDEKSRLRDSLVKAKGAWAPLTVWAGQEIILDGHNRYRICRELGLPFEVKYLHFETRDEVRAWMVENQRARRNLSPDQKVVQDLLSGAEPVGQRIRVSQAKALIASAPEEIEAVERGKKTLSQAFNDWQRRVKPPAPVQPRGTKISKGRIHIVIGDTQVKPGVPTQHLSWIGRYIADQFVGQNAAIIHLGDHYDMPSLSSYDVGTKRHEATNYDEDVKAGNEAFALLNAPIEQAMRVKRWKPERHFLFGNHEERIVRHDQLHPRSSGKFTLQDLDTQGWQRHAFLEPLSLDGITYAHYFIAKNTGKPLAGENAETRLKTVGTSFTMGHQQGRKWAEREIADGRRIAALILGSTYLHDEDYRGPQGNANWRGIAVCHQVENGQYDPMFVSLDYLCRRYEGKTLAQFLARAA